METLIRVPSFKTRFFPEWFHHHGMKMKVREVDLHKKSIIIAGSAAQVQISANNNGWYIQWRVKHSNDTWAEGQIWIKTGSLRSAFGLEIIPTQPGSEWLIERFGGSLAVQGKFICYSNFLNIPGPGTGHDGDSNVSIFITEDIRSAIDTITS